MAATGFTPIQLYYSTTASTAPSAGNLAAGELAINTLDEKLYFKNSAGTVKVIADTVAGATLGANTFTAAQEFATGVSVASAATVNLDSATGNRVHITGTTTITAVTLTRGPRTVIFDGILTLTHNATNNNLPGAANITTAAGDRAIYESDGTTVYCISYIRKDGTAVVTATSSVGNHRVLVNTGNGTGSANTKILRYTTTVTSAGTAITYADSATDGASFTINQPGVYSMTISGESGGTNTFGVSLNSAQLTTNIESITAANRLVESNTPGASVVLAISVSAYLAVNDVIRPHTNGNMSNGSATTTFSICKVNS